MKIINDTKNMVKRGVKFYSYFVGTYVFDLWSKKTTVEELKRRQFEKFHKILTHSYENVPFYREKYSSIGLNPKDIKTEKDILQIPTLTRDEIRTNFPDRMIDENVKIKPDRIGRSSGSTGEAVYFVKSRAWKINLLMCVFRIDCWRNSRFALLTTPTCMGDSCSITDNRITIEDRIRGILLKMRIFPAFYLPSSKNIIMENDEYFNKLIDIIFQYKPAYFVCDPVYLAALARFLKCNNLHLPWVKGVISSYELLQESHKAIFKDVFGCDVYLQYGCSELGDIASECEQHKLHIRMDVVYPEYIWDGAPVPPGGLGKLIVTHLENYKMPLIRYETGDLVRWSDKLCSCGRKTMVLDDIEGRVKDLLHSSTGEVVTSRQIDKILFKARGIDAYKVIQNDYFDIDVLYLNNNKTVKANFFDEITNDFRKIFGKDCKINYQRVQEILSENSNKYRFVYSRIPNINTKAV